MKKLAFLFFLLPTALHARPRYPNPTTPNQVWLNDLDLSDEVQNAKKGVTGGGDACEGCVGEYISSAPASAIPVGTTGNFFDICQIVLTPGDWDISGVASYRRNASVISSTDYRLGIGNVAGASGSGLTEGDNYLILSSTLASTFDIIPFSIPSYRLNLTATTTEYLKGAVLNYSGAVPQVIGRISARRAH